MKTTPFTPEQENQLIDALFERYGSYDILANMLEQHNFVVNATHPVHRMVVAAHSTPTGDQKDRDTFVIRQERPMDGNAQGFLPAKFTLMIVCPNLGCTFALDQGRLDDDKGYLAERDGKVADAYILAVDELLGEVYRALGTKDKKAFSVLF